MDSSTAVSERESGSDRDAVRAATERWFVQQGLPHFIVDYSATENILPRAASVLMLSFLLSVFRNVNPDWSLLRNAAAMSASFVVLVGIWAMANRARGLPALRRPDTVGPVEVGVFVFGPTALALWFRTPRAAVGTAVLKVVHLVLIYYATSYGLVPMTYWNLRRVVERFDLAFRLLARTFPILLLAVTFLFFNSPAWKTITRTPLPRYLALLLLFAGMTLLFVYQTVAFEFGPVSTFESAEEIRTYCADSPVAPLATTAALDASSIPAFTRKERLNAVLMAMYSLWAYVLAVSLAVLAFFVLFGLLAIPAPVISVLVGQPPDSLFTVTFLTTPISFTTQLIRISGFLAVFSGLYLAVHSATDETFRQELEGEVAEQVRRVLAVRAVYRTLVDSETEQDRS